MDIQDEDQPQHRPVLPAQELSEDDDLCSYIFIDQLGVVPGSRLGVYPQQLDFDGPSFVPQSVLSILKETLFREHSDDSGSRLSDAINRFSELPIIKVHLESRTTQPARDRFKEHLRRYLITLQPRSRIEIHTTDQYAGSCERTQLAVYATRPIPSGTTLLELQGRRVALPVEWLTDEDTSQPRRRNDFSLIRSGRKGKNGDQLFLGTARFVNHDCTPNVRLEARDKYVTYQSIREIKVGEEILAFYGDGYFGPDNCDCLCLTCKTNGAGGFSNPSGNSLHGQIHDPPSPAGPSRLSTAASIDVQTPDEINPPILPVTVVGTDGSEHTHDDEEEDSDAESEDVAPRRSKRESALGWKPGHFALRKSLKPRVLWDHQPDDEDDEPPDDTTRCVTCMRLLNETPMTFEDRTFDHHCKRCVRHAFIFNLPWPHRRKDEVQDWPPIHLLPDPNGRLPRKISSVPLPSLGHPEVVPLETLLPITKERFGHAQRRSVLHREKYTMDEYIVDQLRLAAATAAEHEEQLAQAREEAKKSKQAARRLREEKKEKESAGKIRGSGVWTSYEIMTDEELQRREEEKTRLTSGTRRGGRYKADGEEPELIRQAQMRAREKNEVKLRRAEREAGRKIQRRRHDSTASEGTPASDPVDMASPSIDDRPSPAPASDSLDTVVLDDDTDTDEEIQFISVRQAQEIEYLYTKVSDKKTKDSDVTVAPKDEPSPTKPNSALPPASPKAYTLKGFPSARSLTEQRSGNTGSTSARFPPLKSINSARPSAPVTASSSANPSPVKSATSATLPTSTPTTIVASSTSGQPFNPRKRGRPPGTGKLQKMRAEEARNRSNSGSSTSAASPGKETLVKRLSDGTAVGKSDQAGPSGSTSSTNSLRKVAIPFPAQPKTSTTTITQSPPRSAPVALSPPATARDWPMYGKARGTRPLANWHPKPSDTTPDAPRKDPLASRRNVSSSTARPASDASFTQELYHSAPPSRLPEPRDPLPVVGVIKRLVVNGNTKPASSSVPSATPSSTTPTNGSSHKASSIVQSSIPTTAPRSGVSVMASTKDTGFSASQSPSPSFAVSLRPTFQSRSRVLDGTLSGPSMALTGSKDSAGGSTATASSKAVPGPPVPPRPAIPQKRPYPSVLVDEDIFPDEPKRALTDKRRSSAVNTPTQSSTSRSAPILTNGSRPILPSGSSSKTGQLADYARRVSTSPTDAEKILIAQQPDPRKRRIIELSRGDRQNSGPSTPQSARAISSTTTPDSFSLGPRVRMSNGQFGSARSSPAETPQPPGADERQRKISAESSKPTDSWRPKGPALANGSTKPDVIFSVHQTGSNLSVPHRSARRFSVEIPKKPISPSRFYGAKSVATVSVLTKESERPIHQTLRRVDHYQPTVASEKPGPIRRFAFPSSSASSSSSGHTFRPRPVSPGDSPDSDSLDDSEVDSHLESLASDVSYPNRRTSPLKRRSLESTGQSTVSTMYSPDQSSLNDLDPPGTESPLFTPPSSPPKAGSAPFPIAPSTAFPSAPKPQDSWKASESPLRSPSVVVSQRSPILANPSPSYPGSRITSGVSARPGEVSKDSPEGDTLALGSWNRVNLFRRSIDSYTPTASSSTPSNRSGIHVSGEPIKPRVGIMRYDPYHRPPRRSEIDVGPSDRSGDPRAGGSTAYPRTSSGFDLAAPGVGRFKLRLEDWPMRS